MNTNCPACAVPMTEGFVPDYSDNASRRVAEWVTGAPEISFFGNPKVDGRARFALQALRCPQCGLVQLYANTRVY